MLLIAVGVVIMACAVMAMRNTQMGSAPAGGKFIVYGTEWCGFTTKQRKYLDDKYGPGSHQYVDCEKDQGSCSNMNAFPVTKTPNGNMVKGFNNTI